MEREIRVTVTNGARGEANGEVALNAPAGWHVTPAVAPVAFEREDEAQTVRFMIGPGRGVPLGEYPITAVVRNAGSNYDVGYQTVEYPHIQRRQLLIPAKTAMKLIDARTARNLVVGYVMGVGDQVPQAIEQLARKSSRSTRIRSAWAISRALRCDRHRRAGVQRRADLRAHNHRLIEYATNGGTVIVQYNKFEFNEAQYGPYPVKVSSSRITDENAPVTVLEPAHPVFQVPNKIGESAWRGWVQERGLYFLGERDPKYVDLVALEDPFPLNRGEKRRGAGRGAGRQRTVALSGPRALAAAAGRNRRCVSAARQSHQPRKVANFAAARIG